MVGIYSPGSVSVNLKRLRPPVPGSCPAAMFFAFDIARFPLSAYFLDIFLYMPIAAYRTELRRRA
jgi:hypothetical protein